MAVDEDQGIPAQVHVADDGRDLRALQLHPVAVEVEVPAVGPETDALGRPGLVGAVAGVDFLVAVGVEVGDDDQNDFFQPGTLRRGGDVPGQHQAGLLALDLAGVDVGLEVDDGPAVAAQLFRRSDRRVGHDEGGDVEAAGRPADGFNPDERAAFLQLVDEGPDVGVARGGLEVRRLGLGQERRIGLEARRDRPEAEKAEGQKSGGRRPEGPRETRGHGLYP